MPDTAALRVITMRSMAEDGWSPVLSLAELLDDRLTRVDLDGKPVLLYRTAERMFAFAGRCTHAGMPLDRGRVDVAGGDPVITCPAHGSRFRLADGRVVRPPAGAPLASFEVRVEDDVVQIRPRR
jgi:nitrite reductase/ring-hydroxylating ferredoxin subunit